MTTTLKELADLVDGRISGDPETVISGVAGVTDAEPGDIVYAENSKYLADALRSKASAVIVPMGIVGCDKPSIEVADPRYAFARVLEVFAPAVRRVPGIHPSSHIGSNLKIGEDVSVGYNSYVGDDVTLGDRVTLYPFVYIGDRVRLGDDCVIHPFVVIENGVQIGSRVIIHGGTVIGADGFGYTPVGDRYHKVPQIGTVVIHDDVEIGANATIDRAKTGKTEIMSGTKIDNLVQIAHNCVIGENCIIAGQSGLSGSVVLGDRVVMAGQCGIRDHATIGHDTTLAGRSGIIGDIPPNSMISGYPASPHNEQMRMHAVMRRLPELYKQVQELEKRLEALEEQSE